MHPYRFHPTVFCVSDTYQIIFLTEKPGMAWVEIAGETYPDAQNGILRCTDDLHRVTVPQAVLDRAGGYAVCYQEVTERAPYFPVHGDTVRREYRFFPVNPQKELRICYLSDTHGEVEGPVACAAQEPFDVLIMGGDIANHNSTRENLWVLFDICSQAVRGEKPVVFSRGNHDTRGHMAEYLPGMIGTDHGNTYFTFELPGVFGLVLDAGEDKLDCHAEYGGTTCFELFRRQETRWLESVYQEGKWKNAPLRIAVCHIPFVRQNQEPFDIEKELYAHWTELLNQMGIEFLIAGHKHKLHILQPGDAALATNPAFTTLIGSETPTAFTAAYYTIYPHSLMARFRRSDGEIRLQTELARTPR